MSGPRIGNLVVYSGEVRPEDLIAPNSTRYKIVEAMIHLALSLLETQAGRRSLADVAAAIIQERDNTPGSRSRRPPHIYRDSIDNLPSWIQRFITRMRGNFPPVCISGRCLGEAEAEKHNWGAGPGMNMDMGRYDAGPAAGILFLSEPIISNMLYVVQEAEGTDSNSYKLFKFQMTISVAHEIVHFLTGFITGTQVPDTPPRVTAPPYDNRTDMGEAGRFWESRLLGGFVEFWFSPSDPLGVRQPGRPYLFNAGSLPTATGQPVSMGYVEELLNAQFTFPVRASRQTPPVTRNALKRGGSREMTFIRESPAFRNTGLASSPPPGHPSEGSRFRGIQPSPVYGYTDRARENSSRRFFR